MNSTLLMHTWPSLLLLIIAIVAGAEEVPGRGGTVPFLDYTPHGTQPGLTYPLLDAGQCSTCHSNGPVESHYPSTGWSGSMMANSLRDPLFWAALDVANADGAANGAPGIGDFCLRCHTPKGWYGGRVRKQTDVIVVSGETNASDVVEGTDGCLLAGDYDNPDFDDYQGIGCQFCHRIREDIDPSSLQNANVTLDDSDCGGEGEPCRSGPYSYPTPEFGGPPHAWEFSTFLSDSKLCGSCHDVTSPMVDNGSTVEPFRTLIIDNQTAGGLNTGIAFPAERTYSEWKSSDFNDLLFRDSVETGGDAIRGSQLARGATCQDCHMQQATSEIPDEEFQVCSFGPDRAGNLAMHQFVGANTWIPGILKGEYPNLGRALAFDQTISWANELLSTNTALLEADATIATDLSSIDATVKVTNLAGHKLPTGYAEGRRMWIEIVVEDANDAVLWSDGTWDAGTGELTIIDHASIYEIKQGIWENGDCVTENGDGKEQFHFVLNNCIAKDNRIPPLGFTGLGNLEIQPVGEDYPETFPGSGKAVNHSTRQYTIPLPENVVTPLTVSARLRIQIASKEYIEFLRDEAVDNGFADENALCSGAPDRPFTVGPQEKSRGQFVFDLWNSVEYGKSPPVDIANAVISVGE